MFCADKYFDHAATTIVRKEAYVAMEPFLKEMFGNPASLHQFGLQAKEAVEAARKTVAETIGASSKDLIFTGSGTESNNLAVLGAARRMRQLGKGMHLVTSEVEHPSVREAMRALGREGFQVTCVPVDSYGRVNPTDIRAAIRPNTVLISIMHANNVTGTIQPIQDIGKIAREQGVLFHCDAVQSYGKLPLHVDDLQVDLLTLNAHKIGGPKGVAALYVRKGVRLDPILYGGGQERGLRPATLHTAGIVGFAKAAVLAVQDQAAEWERMTRLRSRLVERLKQTIPGFTVNGFTRGSGLEDRGVEGLPHILNISIARIEGQALMLELDRFGFATSSGSACSATDHEPSYVLLAMGRSRDAALESLRISMGRTTTEESVDQLASALEQAAKQWRSG
ncbi:cysteine desulfurase family protein [Effusibacillus dendaii]|uniref:Cysteine desulfurase NifS n=1 Tax=Effusibacillus dendaii TaxID=2743772 RepID=A0A7I8D867_9BACL|nr:cysteine desulfurase family protein [Effusibacillus dendaii]BCJ86338.1 cysteine desulfurase NifS [Effusibacillus dendaii]